MEIDHQKDMFAILNEIRNIIEKSMSEHAVDLLFIARKKEKKRRQLSKVAAKMRAPGKVSESCTFEESTGAGQERSLNR